MTLSLEPIYVLDTRTLHMKVKLYFKVLLYCQVHFYVELLKGSTKVKKDPKIFPFCQIGR